MFLILQAIFIKKSFSNNTEENQNNNLRAKSDCTLDSIIINNDAINNFFCQKSANLIKIKQTK